MKPDSDGFTLLELLVALLLTGLVLVIARGVFDGVASDALLLRAGRAPVGIRVEPRRWLGNAFFSLATIGPEGQVRGTPESVAFMAWTERAEGWCATEHVTIAARHDTLFASGDASGPQVLATGVLADSLDYLLAGGATLEWGRVWTSEASAPEAIRIRVVGLWDGHRVSDTLLFLIKEHG